MPFLEVVCHDISSIAKFEMNHLQTAFVKSCRYIFTDHETE